MMPADKVAALIVRIVFLRMTQGLTTKITDERHLQAPEPKPDAHAAHSVHRFVKPGHMPGSSE
jgi:hypothetical protein